MLLFECLCWIDERICYGEWVCVLLPPVQAGPGRLSAGAAWGAAVSEAGPPAARALCLLHACVARRRRQLSAAAAAARSVRSPGCPAAQNETGRHDATTKDGLLLAPSLCPDAWPCLTPALNRFLLPAASVRRMPPTACLPGRAR